MFSEMKEAEMRKMLDENVVLPLWPETGKLLGLGRGTTYSAAAKGDIKTIRFGRLVKVPTSWLRQKLGPDEPAS
jgi:excisionase family DNA binding protein